MVLIPTCLPFSWQYSTSELAADSHVSPDCSCSPLLAVDVGLHQECTCHGAAACCLYDLYFTWLPSIGCTILWNRLKVAMADLDVDCLLSTLWRNLKENSHIDPNSCLFFLLYIDHHEVDHCTLSLTFDCCKIGEADACWDLTVVIFMRTLPTWKIESCQNCLLSSRPML